MTKLYKTDALVLYSVKYGETDAILTILSPDKGKIQAIAKGARKIKSRMRGPTQPFVYGSFMLYLGKSLHTVTQCEYKEPFAGLREDYHKYAMASYVSELAKSALLEGDSQVQGIFTLTLKALYALEAEANEIYLRYYELNLLRELGYELALEECGNCGKELGKITGGFSVEAGGMICSDCKDKGELNVSPPTLAIMRQLMLMDILKVKRLKFTKAVASELDKICHKAIMYYLDPRLNSRRFLADISTDSV
ncbi:DNA repair protein RecO (recombination protein O) [Desulfitispora alkaliphila]|uniref:DNA repair protein RecO n=1 Tax=Desulfitispora alkaliphila TaxID=622674 RepID=UPI003D237740